MNELHLFAGAGGGILGGHLLGHTTVCAVEIEPYCRQILLQRQRDGILPRFPIWDDVTTFDGTSWRGKVDVVCGGFPCQDISSAGGGAGISGARSGLWKEMFRIIGEIQPRFAFVENSPLLVGRGLAVILADLAELGYDARWGVLGADHVGAIHHRARMWLVAYPCSFGKTRWNGGGLEISQTIQRRSHSKVSWEDLDQSQFAGKRYKDMPKPLLAGMEDDVAHKLDRIKFIGNGQVPRVAATAFRLLSQSLTK